VAYVPSELSLTPSQETKQEIQYADEEEVRDCCGPNGTATSVVSFSQDMFRGSKEYISLNVSATVNYRPVLSSERALQNKKQELSKRKSQGERKIGSGSQMGA
jgi:hypothetical protein